VRLRIAFLLGLVALGSMAGNADANGDPASDVLPFTTVFLSVQNPKGSSAGRELLALTKAAAKEKYPIRVAVISEAGDLGLAQSLWEKPQKYAEFLGQELFQFGRYHGTLVVSMPNGFGVYGPGATARAKRALKVLPKPGTGDLERLGKATAIAVRRLAALNGHPLPASAGGSGTPGWVIVLAGAGGAALVAGAAFVALRRWLLQP
jgi:hypothetical protein